MIASVQVTNLPAERGEMSVSGVFRKFVLIYQIGFDIMLL
jgi:hypothetical protein